ncbi:hypothetical protein E4191_12755 [Paracoccus liaowanqingii]|uniref:Uncharacterized protein n=1 Tax=Paracoccus liaowanqingii TaxID=2560053 RepID=A0A4P7HP27_9RHOB|nr:hypothetical protein [Paracoccus liaowanqingii]QBX35463.1 hypothetical protein E4191_12755 [Paracoccus liaowanqingii]
MNVKKIPVAAPIWLNPSALDGFIGDGQSRKLTVVTNLLRMNCVRARAALLLFQQVNKLLPPLELANSDVLAYAEAERASLELEHQWRLMAARDMIFAARNFSFLLGLLSGNLREFRKNPEKLPDHLKKFGLIYNGRITIELNRISEDFDDYVPGLHDLRNAAAHADEIYRKDEKKPISQTMESLEGMGRDDGCVMIIDSMADDDYIVTTKKHALKFPVSPKVYIGMHSAFCSVARQLQG